MIWLKLVMLYFDIVDSVGYVGGFDSVGVM